jgi:hypothetical protein
MHEKLLAFHPVPLSIPGKVVHFVKVKEGKNASLLIRSSLHHLSSSVSSNSSKCFNF